VRPVATFREAYQAYLGKGKLEAEGISSIVVDEYLVGINWMYSQAIGGVKLQVPEADYERAADLLKEDYAKDLEAMEQEITKETCPKCGSRSISLRAYSKWWLIPSLFFAAPIFFRKKKWRCADCGEVW
jgi:predicted RNA-binding Zn-ribbon protein involved in translation (DUF1610 family)